MPAATYIYKGSLKMTQKVFVPELLTTTSTQYIDMVNEVKPEVSLPLEVVSDGILLGPRVMVIRLRF